MRAYPPTPGPWFVDGGQVVDGRGNIIATRHSGRTIGKDEGDIAPVEADSNTHLMAAAPELRDALVALMARFEQTGEAWMTDPSMETARAALVKAGAR